MSRCFQPTRLRPILAHAEFRRAASAALAPDNIAGWRATAGELAHGMLRRLSERGGAVDLVTEFAAPWSLALAAIVTGVAEQDAERLSDLAFDIFEAAAHPFHSGLQAQSHKATVEMARCLPDAFHVQAFTALSQTVPVFLAQAWLALLRHPVETAALRARPELWPTAMEELLRYAGPSQALSRYAVQDIELRGRRIRRGQRVILKPASANRDPAQFPQPERLNLQRSPNPHLAFGAGEHACVGAALARMAAAAATAGFLEFFASAKLQEGAEPPVALWISL